MSNHKWKVLYERLALLIMMREKPYDGEKCDNAKILRWF